MRALSVALITISLSGPALADFKYVAEKSDFDGIVTKIISLEAEGNHGPVAVWSNSPANIVKSTYYSLAWQPRDHGYICASGADNLVPVRWVRVDENGAINKVTGDPVIFKIRDGKKILEIEQDATKQNQQSVIQFFEALEMPGNVRVTFTDKCGKTSLEDLPTKGFVEALASYRS